MDAKEFNGMESIPEELLESIAGGVLDEDDREAIRKFAQDLKEHDISLEATLGYFRANLDGSIDSEDVPECEQIIRAVYEG